jgi:inorganic pyrophosphatase
MSFKDLTIGGKAPEVVHAVIEIPKGSHNKYEYDEALDVIKLDRVLHSSVYYPVDYGFIPQTRSKDGDHLDILVIVSESVFPGCMLSARPIGVLYMVDQKEEDEKIIAVAEGDPLSAGLKDIGDVDEFYKKVIHNFFETYKKLEEKIVEVHHWHDKETAHKIITEAKDRFLAEQK